MILVLGGTHESKNIAQKLVHSGYEVIATVTTDYGRQILEGTGVKEIIVEKQTFAKLARISNEYNIKIIIDATHPFAVEISQLAVELSQTKKMEYIRLERNEVDIPENSNIIQAFSLQEALEETVKFEKKIFSTIGSKHLNEIIDFTAQKNIEVAARVLPVPEVIAACKSLNIALENIIALKGPFSKEFNKRLYVEYNSGVVLTKESGTTGGLKSKIDAAIELDIPCVIWRKPELNYPRKFYKAEDILETVNNQI